MTEEKIKEYLSNNYVASIAGKSGFYLQKLDQDNGVDFMVRYEDVRIEKGKYRYITSPNFCDIQLKSTTIKGIRENEEYIFYDLQIKNYNDLIDRRNKGFAPLYLILFILPENKNDWVKVLKDKLVLSKHAFWYYPQESDKISSNLYTKTISIPKKNKLGTDFFKNKIDEWFTVRG